MAPLVRRVVLTIISALCGLFLYLHFSEKTLLQTSIFREQLSSPAPPSSPKQDVDTKDHPPFSWRDVPEQYPVDPLSMLTLPRGPDADIPQIQFDFRPNAESATHRKERQRRLSAVKEAFQHSWNGYRKNAWLHDEVKPLSGLPSDPFGGWAATLVDTLDTLWIIGLQTEFEDAVDALHKIDFSKAAVKEINVFETTIRYLGGFLSAYDLSGGQYPLLLQKAEEVAELLYKAFDTPNRMPITRWDWKKYLQKTPQVAPKNEVVAEIGSLTMEFTRLSQLTSNPKYFDAVQRIANAFEAEQSRTLLPGLWPLTVNALTLNMHDDTRFTIGGMADSVFEYLGKQHLLLSGRAPAYATMHTAMIEATKTHLTFEPMLPPTLKEKHALSPLFVGSLNVKNNDRNISPEGQHLTCFAGGMFALGARALRNSPEAAASYEEDMKVARRLTDGCIWSYYATPLGIGPEIFYMHPCRSGRDAVTGTGDCTWDRATWLSNLRSLPRDADKGPGGREAYAKDHHLEEGFTQVHEPKYILRPEAIESVFVLYRTTGDESLREHAWRMFESVVRYTRTSVAFAEIPDVMTPPGGHDDYDDDADDDGRPEGGVQQKDGMESFWTAETLKYYYLIFEEPDVVSLDEYVFNTEAHPLSWRRGRGGRTRSGGVGA